MEKLSSATKRKKRRTRKCLDELRNRSRSRRDDFFTLHNNGQNSKISNHDDIKKSKSFITLNRLTLAMFPKSVRSETITRPILEEMKQKTNLNKSEEIKVFTAITSRIIREPEIELINDNAVHPNYAVQSIAINNQRDKDETLTYKDEKFSVSRSYQEDHSLDRLILFNPKSKTRVDDKLLSTTPSSQSSENDYGYHIYEELMAEIPVYLKEKTSILIKEDVIKITRALLQKLYMESCHQECEDNVIKCMKSHVPLNTIPYTCKETVFNNPMDYIRLEYERQQNTLDKHGSVTNSSSLQLKGHSSLGPLESSTSPLKAVMQDTPEYSYYPHKLNQ